MDRFLDSLKYDSQGLVPAVIQDHANGEVLMVGYMNRQAVRRTLTSGRTCFWSRSRQEYWVKGETSGNVQKVVSVSVDCDRDCLLVKVEQAGPACHEGYRSCFFCEVDSEGGEQVTGRKPSEVAEDHDEAVDHTFQAGCGCGGDSQPRRVQARRLRLALVGSGRSRCQRPQ